MTLLKNIPEVNRAINNILLNDYGTITSTLARRFGQENLNDIDTLVCESLNRARVKWSSTSVPSDPKNTVWQIITDNTSDLFCNKLKYRNISSNKFADSYIAGNLHYPDEAESVENKVTMLFTCCHPALSENCRTYLVLKILCGFSTSYIARLYRRNESAAANDIFRSKKMIIEQNIPMNIPSFNRQDRLQIVMDTLYRIFESGMSPENEKLRAVPELCFVAVNLAKVLTRYSHVSTPGVYAMIALMLFRASRLNALLDEKNNLLSLKEQDRTKWNRSMIREGLEYLHSSADGNEISLSHLKAGIEAIHCLAKDYGSTDWNRIISLYDNYLRVSDSPGVELERAVAISHAKGTRKGLQAIENIKDKTELKDNRLYHATLGNMYLRIHKYESALHCYREALKLSARPYDRTYIINKINICKQRIEMTVKYRYGLSF